MDINLIFSLLSTIVSIVAVVISYFCYRTVKRQTFTVAYASYRIEWIHELRNLLNEFCEYHTHKNIEKMKLCKKKIDILLNFKYYDHKNLSDLLECAISNKCNSLEEVISYSQIVIDSYWRKAKNEAFMDTRTNRKIRKKTYNDDNLYD